MPWRNRLNISKLYLLCSPRENGPKREMPQAECAVGHRYDGKDLVYYSNVISHCPTYSGNNFDAEEARVICRQLGFAGGQAVSGAYFGQGTGIIWLDDLKCNSTKDTHLHLCASNGWGNHDCSHYEDAGVRCSEFMMLLLLQLLLLLAACL